MFLLDTTSRAASAAGRQHQQQRTRAAYSFDKHKTSQWAGRADTVRGAAYAPAQNARCVAAAAAAAAAPAAAALVAAPRVAPPSLASRRRGPLRTAHHAAATAAAREQAHGDLEQQQDQQPQQQPDHQHQQQQPKAAAPAAAPARVDLGGPTVVFDGASELSGTIQVHEVPPGAGVPAEVRGSRLLYAGDPPRLVGVHKPLGDPYPLTYAPWDYFAALPVLLGEGAIGIFGWGGGATARLLCEAYAPPPPLAAWEPDRKLLDVCRTHMGTREVQAAAAVSVSVGDPLDPKIGVLRAPAPRGVEGGSNSGSEDEGQEGASSGGSSSNGSSAAAAGGFAGIIVDLFVGGRLHPALTDARAWASLRARLAAGGRVMARLGPAAAGDGGIVPETVAALNAAARAFGGTVAYVDPPEGSQLDVLVLTGPLPDPSEWAAAVGPLLAPYTQDWEVWEAADDDDSEEQEQQQSARGGNSGGVDGNGASRPRKWGEW